MVIMAGSLGGEDMEKAKIGNTLFLTIILCFSIILFGCTETKEVDKSSESKDDSTISSKADDLKVVMSSQPSTLDTHVDTSEPAAVVAHHVFETLVSFDSNNEIKPMLADSWEFSDDNLQLVFKLREGIKFHNGNEMIADDIVASFNRWKELSNLGSAFEGTTIESSDSYTVTLHFQSPMSTALDLLAHQKGEMFSIMPADIANNANSTGVEEFVGTGPFKFEEWVQDQHILLTKYADYQPRAEEPDGMAGKREAMVGNLYFMFITDPQTQVAGLQTGEFDFVYRVPPDLVSQLEKNSDLEVQTFPSGELNVYLNKRKGIFTDKRARQAIAMAMDYETILTGVYKDEYTLDHNLMGDNKRWYSDAGKEKYNVTNQEKAKEMFSEAGYEGEELTLLASSDFIDHHNAAIIIHEQLRDFGLNLKLEEFDWPTVSEMRDNKDDYDILIQTQYPKPVPNAQYYLSENYTGWTNSSELDEIVEGLISATSLEQAQTSYSMLQKWFYDYTPIARVGVFNMVIAYRETVNNFQYFGQPVFWNVFVDEDK